MEKRTVETQAEDRDWLSMESWTVLNCLSPELQQLILWRNWRKTALMFCGTLALLLGIVCRSVISVICVSGITALTLTIGYRCYVLFMQWMRHSQESAAPHPFRRYLDMDLSISPLDCEKWACAAALRINALLLRLRSLFLAENLIESLKLLAWLCAMSVIGDYFNALTLCLLAFVALFTLPKLYEWQKPLIDAQLDRLLRLLQTLSLCLPRCHAFQQCGDNNNNNIVIDDNNNGNNNNNDNNSSDNDDDDDDENVSSGSCGEKYTLFDHDHEHQLEQEFIPHVEGFLRNRQ